MLVDSELSIALGRGFNPTATRFLGGKVPHDDGVKGILCPSHMTLLDVKMVRQRR